MTAQRRTNNVNRDVERELVRLLAEVEARHQPAEVVLAGRRYHLVPVEDARTAEDPFKDYDADRVIAAIDTIKASGGGLEGLDIDAFLDEIMEMRDQDTPDHRF